MTTTQFSRLLFLTLVSAGCGASSIEAPATLASCSTALLNGSYGSQKNGQTAPGSVWTSVGVAVFDGQGNIAFHQAVSVNGVTTNGSSESGTYTVNADCTGTENDSTGKPISTLVVVHGGDQVIGESLLPGGSMAIHYERITGPCVTGMLSGDYGYQRNGQTGPGASLLALGTINFDGKGNSVSAQTIDRGGTITHVANQLGTYAINSDCTGTQADAATGIVFSRIVIVAGGDTGLGMSTTPGNNVVLHYERIK